VHFYFNDCDLLLKVQRAQTDFIMSTEINEICTNFDEAHRTYDVYNKYSLRIEIHPLLYMLSGMIFRQMVQKDVFLQKLNPMTSI
jgi:hypothetical protein